MEFGLFNEIPVAHPRSERSEYDAFHNTVAMAELCDSVGFHSFWTVEHHFLDEFSHCSAPEVLYGYVAARTKNLRIGHGVRLMPWPYNHPVRVAEQAAVLDLLCDGRLEFGVGRSSTRLELEGFGIDPKETRASLAEGLAMVLKAWRDEAFSWDSERFSIPPRQVLPKPLQRPHPPLWMACSSPESHRQAGEMGVGLLSFTVGVPPEELGERIAMYREGLAQAKPVGSFVNDRAATFTMVHCADTQAEAEANARASVEWYAATAPAMIASVAHWQAEQASADGGYDYIKEIKDIDFAEVMKFELLQEMGAVIVGDPDHCIEVCRRFEKAGCDLLLCLKQPHAIEHDKIMRSIELIGRHVIPALNSN